MSYSNYPLVTPEGEPIPIDILEPVDALPAIAISSSAMLASVVIPSYADRFLEIWATVSCNIGFNVTPVDGVGEPGIYHLRADDPRLIIPVGGYISAITIEGSGYLYVNLVSRWGAMKKDYQTEVGE